MPAGRRERGELANEVLAALSVADRPLTPAEVLAELGGDLAYTTVLTTLTRLHEKGLVEREAAGRAHAYRPADRAELAARRMRQVLEASGSGGVRQVALARFVDQLDPAELPLLAQLLAEAERTGAAVDGDEHG